MGKADPRKLTAQEKRKAAVELRMAGLTYAKIGQQIGLSESQTYKTIQKALSESVERTQKDSDQIVEMELLRLDRISQTLWTNVVKGDLKAIDRYIKVMQQRAKLLGLDAPLKVASTDKDGEDTESGVIVVPAVAGSVEEWLNQYKPQS